MNFKNISDYFVIVLRIELDKYRSIRIRYPYRLQNPSDIINWKTDTAQVICIPLGEHRFVRIKIPNPREVHNYLDKCLKFGLLKTLSLFQKIIQVEIKHPDMNAIQIAQFLNLETARLRTIISQTMIKLDCKTYLQCLFKVISRQNHLPATNQISIRESAILYHLIKGRSAKRIAHKLLIPESTITSRAESIRSKLQCHSLRAALIKVLKDGGTLRTTEEILALDL